MRTYRFIKEYSGWYIDLPDYLAQGGSKADLAMVPGADTMLDIMAGQENEVHISLDTEPFENSDLLELEEVCHPDVGGGNYILRTYKGQSINHRMWLCAVTDFVFGYLPERIYIKLIQTNQ